MNRAIEATEVAVSIPTPTSTGVFAHHQLSADSHLRLGITRVGFSHFLATSGWSNYQRPEALRWVEEAYGKQLTGYDLCEHIRDWLRQTNNVGLSVCEVLARQGSKHVRRGADCFLSHVQARPVEDFCETLVMVPERFARHLPLMPFFWIDYMSLRQSHNDFNVHHIRALIAEIGCTLVELDERANYLARTFCIFETFANAEAAGQLLLYDTHQSVSYTHQSIFPQKSFSGIVAVLYCGRRVESEAMRARRALQVNSATAQAHMAEHKQQIDTFIVTTVGFEALDRTIMQAINAGMDMHVRDFHVFIHKDDDRIGALIGIFVILPSIAFAMIASFDLIDILVSGTTRKENRIIPDPRGLLDLLWICPAAILIRQLILLVLTLSPEYSVIERVTYARQLSMFRALVVRGTLDGDSAQHMLAQLGIKRSRIKNVVERMESYEQPPVAYPTTWKYRFTRKDQFYLFLALNMVGWTIALRIGLSCDSCWG